MNLPELKNSQNYQGLYVIDFGQSCSVGFTAEETAEILESEKYVDAKVYKIHNACPDGRIELKGIHAETFQLETGLFFYSADLETAEKDFKTLTRSAVETPPPGRAKVHLAKYGDQKFVVAMIYPAEYDDEFSDWLLRTGYTTAGVAEGGIEAVQRYYDQGPEILQRHQLFGENSYQSRTGEELLTSVKLAVQR